MALQPFSLASPKVKALLLQGGKDNVARSIEYYHKALSLRPEDTLSTEMLTLALQVRFELQRLADIQAQVDLLWISAVQQSSVVADRLC